MSRIRALLAVGCVLPFATACEQQCFDKIEPPQFFCTPEAGLPSVTLRAVEACGKCDDSEPTCEVTVQGNAITLALRKETCHPPVTTSCSDRCRQTVVDCPLTGLDAGTYTVFVGQTSRPLVVDPDAGVASCEVPGF